MNSKKQYTTKAHFKSDINTVRAMLIVINILHTYSYGKFDDKNEDNFKGFLNIGLKEERITVNGYNFKDMVLNTYNKYPDLFECTKEAVVHKNTLERLRKILKVETVCYDGLLKLDPYWSIPVDIFSSFDYKDFNKLGMVVYTRDVKFLKETGKRRKDFTIKKFTSEELTKEELEIYGTKCKLIYVAKPAKEESKLYRQYSGHNCLKKELRERLGKGYYEADINACASQTVAQNIENQYSRDCILAKIEDNKFYRDDETICRNESKDNQNKFMFSQTCKYNAWDKVTDKNKEEKIEYIQKNTTLTDTEARYFVEQVLKMREEAFTREELQRDYLGLEKYIEEFGNKTVIQRKKYKVQKAPLIRIHDAVYIKGQKRIKALIKFLNDKKVIFKVKNLMTGEKVETQKHYSAIAKLIQTLSELYYHEEQQKATKEA